MPGPSDREPTFDGVSLDLAARQSRRDGALVDASRAGAAWREG